jgi:DNA modification methylase
VLTNGDISPVRLMWGTAARMDAISNGEADLVFAGPPYFSEETESHLLKPLKQQTDFNLVKDLLKRDTEELVECYTDITRILKPGRALVIQIKDIKFGDFYVPISGWHLELAIRNGLRLITQISWLPSAGRAQTGAKSYKQKGKVRTYRALETERFYILGHPCGLTSGHDLEDAIFGDDKLIQPLWNLPPNGRVDSHPYSSPESVATKLINLLTEPGELVVDPFAGFGGILKVANKLSRKAIGYEIDMKKWIDRKKVKHG